MWISLSPSPDGFECWQVYDVFISILRPHLRHLRLWPRLRRLRASRSAAAATAAASTHAGHGWNISAPGSAARPSRVRGVVRRRRTCQNPKLGDHLHVATLRRLPSMRAASAGRTGERRC